MVLQMRRAIPQGHKWDVPVDLFFYREPEEAKEQKEDDAAVAIGMGDQWTAAISDGQWTNEATAPVAGGWTGDALVSGADEWESAAAASGWE